MSKSLPERSILAPFLLPALNLHLGAGGCPLGNYMISYKVHHMYIGVRLMSLVALLRLGFS
ncbi:hypothetical protein THOE12_50013 [Vibrio rotiferianus]|nr:hypothetical protein THOE12_50013 [Vibrio rotiferianus]